MAINVLNAMTFPLFGKRLIEASAGTGKTYTIANLYLRLLLPTNSNYDFARPLTVDQILVVTFTEAATAELKARIRLRIRQARKALLQADNTQAMTQLEQEDAFLSELIRSLTAEQKATGVEYLLYAEKQMDEAAIFTIHGFCQRMLSQNAFESRMLFQQSIETDDQTPLAIAVKDVWRINIYPLSPEAAALIKPIWSGPEALQKELRVLQNQPDVQIKQSKTHIEGCGLEDLLEQTKQQLHDIKQAWLTGASDILSAMNASGLDGRFWVVKKQDSVAQTLLTWAQSKQFTLPKKLEKFNADLHNNKLKKNGLLPEHDFFQQVAALYANYPSPDKIKPTLLKTFWQQTQNRLALWKQQSQKLTFTDLLTSLDAALSASNEEALSHRIRQLYPLALIDEFQDTDPVQFRVFNRIYGTANEGNRQLGLVMIGDPKQAIYAFRGADIYTYLTARDQVDAIYALDTNYRSSAAMIQSVNALFAGHHNPFRVNGIPFSPVKDRATNSAFCRGGSVEPALQLLCDEAVFADEAVLSPAQYQQQMAEQTGQHIAELLLDGQQGQATLSFNLADKVAGGVNKTKTRGIYSGDIAVLVAGYQQAHLIKRSLAKRGVASVYLSDRGSVFSSNEARDLLLILQAVLSQGQEIPLRTALATDLLGWTLAELDQLNQDDLFYEAWVEKFQGYYQLWDQSGILPMLRVLMQDLSIPQKLLATPLSEAHTVSLAENRMQGERRLTDLLHLGEKLQQKSMELESKEGLVRYLTLAIQQPDGNNEEQKIRLETDDDLVRIITIHKSKGLEYPIVYLPFACAPFRNKDAHALYHDVDNQLYYVPTPEEEQTQKHAEELYAGEMRLAYVALTRAREACYIGCAQVGKPASKTKAAELQVHLSGVGALLCRGKPQELGAFEQSVKQWLQNFPAPLMALQTNASAIHSSVTDSNVNKSSTLPNPLFGSSSGSLSDKQTATDAEGGFAVARFSGVIERDWWIGSYSSLVTGIEQTGKLKSHLATLETSEPGLDEFTRLPQSIDLNSTMENADQHDEMNAFTFPRGAKAGSFLHDLLEGKWLNKPADKVTFTDLTKTHHQALIMDYLQQQDYGDWINPLLRWLQDIITTEIVTGICLQHLSAQQCRKEMEFFLPVKGFNAQQLDQVARRHDTLSAQAPTIEDQHLKGMLKGFIDLLFEHDGKYYVVDYKSNHLGMQRTDYNQSNMSVAMVEHRYDLQYQLYTLALHRFLKQRLPNYDYEQHIGGVCYLFLRGLGSPQVEEYEQVETNAKQKTGVFFTRLTQAHVQELDQLIAGEPKATTHKAANEKTTRSKETKPADDANAGGQYDLF